MAKLRATTYDGLMRLLEQGRSDSKTIGNNTTAELDGDVIWIRLHGKKIVKLLIDGQVYFSLAGWPTTTTRERVNQFIGRNRVYQSKNVQFLNEFPIDDYDWHYVDL